MAAFRRRVAATSLCLAVLVSAAAGASGPDEDHPLVGRYAGSKLLSKKAQEFGEYTLVTGRTTKGDLVTADLKGRITRIVYENPEGRSTLEIFANYEKALDGAGFVPAWQCALEACGPAYARSAWARVAGLFAAADGDPRYLARPSSLARVARPGWR